MSCVNRKISQQTRAFRVYKGALCLCGYLAQSKMKRRTKSGAVSSLHRFFCALNAKAALHFFGTAIFLPFRDSCRLFMHTLNTDINDVYCPSRNQPFLAFSITLKKKNFLFHFLRSFLIYSKIILPCIPFSCSK